MSANIPAIVNLFPASNGTGYPSLEDSDTIRGIMPFDILKAQLPVALDSTLITVVDSIRADAHWGPVWDGDLSKYDDDHSAADLALCGELGRRGLTAGAIDTAFRASSLYRAKWERDDYRARTIAKALHGLTATQGDDEPSHSRLSLDAGLLKISLSPPPPRDYTIGELLLAVKSCILAGLGGVSKTQLVTQLGISISLGIPFLGKPVKQGKVLLILAEEDQQEIDRRINAVVRNKNMTPTQLQSIRDNVRAFGLVGEDTRLTAKIDGALQVTRFSQEIIDAAIAFGDVRLIVLDHVALFHGGDFNAREDAALTMRAVNHIAKETGASVLLLAHSPKASRNAEESNPSMVAGSTAFVDQARGVWGLAAMREQEAKKLGISAGDSPSYVSLTVAKNNYGPTGEVFWFRRVPFDGVGLLEHVELTPPQPTAKNAGALETVVLNFIITRRGQFSKTGLRDSQAGQDGPLKASKGNVAAAIENLLTDGRLVTREPTQGERKKFDLGPRVKLVLDVGIE